MMGVNFLEIWSQYILKMFDTNIMLEIYDIFATFPDFDNSIGT